MSCPRGVHTIRGRVWRVCPRLVGVDTRTHPGNFNTEIITLSPRRMNSTFVSLCGMVCMCLLAACGGGDGGTAPGNNNGGNGGGTLTDRCVGVTNCVAVGDNFYSPSSKTVPANTTVTWMWNGEAPHDIQFNDNVHAPTATRASGGTYARTFTAAGTYSYFCTIHGQGMSGTVIVQ